MKRTTRLSVILPVYNGERFLDDAVQSVLAQTYDDFELIALDDGSSDRTLEILKSYEDKDSRVSVLQHSNRGLGATLNRGIAESHGELIARQDADDLSFPDRFALQIKYFDSHPDVVLLGTASTVIDEDGNRLYDKSVPTEDSVLRHMLMTTSPFYHGSVIFRRSAVIEAGGYPDLRWYEDLFLWRSLSRGGKVANLEEILYQYRVGPLNWHLPRRSRREVANLFLRNWPEDDLSPEDFELLESIRKKITPKIRRAQYHLDVAKGLAWDEEDRNGARRHLLQAIIVKPFMAESWFNLVLSLLPAFVGKWWNNRRIKQAAPVQD